MQTSSISVMGKSAHAVIRERDIRIIWRALSALKASDEKAWGMIKDEEIDTLLTIVGKACNESFNKQPPTDSACQLSSDRLKFLGTINNMKVAKRKREERRAKGFSFPQDIKRDIRKRKTYEYGLSYDNPEIQLTKIRIERQKVILNRNIKMRKTYEYGLSYERN